MTRKKYNVILSRRADRMLIMHTEFLTQASIAAAIKLLNDFKKAINYLSDNPFQYPYADELDVSGIPPETYRKCIFDKRYKALYLIEGDDVYIDAVIDCRQENTDLY